MAEILNADKQSDQLLRKLLLVEDNPGDVRLVQEALRESSVPVQISVARDGQKALEMLESLESKEDAGRPDLILLDLNLPFLSGNELLIRLKTNPITRQIPVIIFSTSGSPDDIYQSYQNRANCYISKPADLDQYLEVTRKLFDYWLRLAKMPEKTT